MPTGISFGAGTLYVSALPTHNPGSDGARRAINTATGEKYRWVSGMTWEVEPGDGDPTTWLNSLPEYETDDEANGDLNAGEFYWLAPPPDVGQNRTLKQRT